MNEDILATAPHIKYSATKIQQKNIFSGDRKRRRRAEERQEAVAPLTRNQPRSWKVMLLILASLMIIVVGGSPGEGWSPETSPVTEGSPGEAGKELGEVADWPSPDHLELNELEDNSALPLQSSLDNLFSEPSLPELSEDHQNRWERSAPGSGQQKGSKKGRRKSKPSSSGDCKIRTLHVRVQDLGLGYDSEELVLFKYCAGSCHLARSNHDVTLSTLLQKKIIHGGRGEEKISSHPCCRPTRYEPITFMDIQNRWKAVEKISAAECSCLG
ncbi:glial cell line-derived neurotrophic factor-like [Acipenser oxyrinchus oxyrinchus]|uniref:Artemin n=1 Tax=Acipenser oxyrinchus oxyrinchus TaxID=40147 RepID=A0AAD8DAK1_ACIOX|nr:glial cell line-derived neurotrophic factor-like [Acipenser oxyrinchus oxyrinchus]